MKDERRNGIPDICYPVYIIHHIHRPYIDARSKEYQQSQTKQNGRIFGNNLLPRTLARMPDIIEGKLYLLHQRNDGIEKHHDTRTDDIVALRILNIIVNEVNNGLRYNGLCLEGGREPGFEQRGIAETTGYDKHHCHERYHSHEGGKSQGSHIPGPHILEIEDATGKHTHLDPRLESAPEVFDIRRIEFSDIFVKA